MFLVPPVSESNRKISRCRVVLRSSKGSARRPRYHRYYTLVEIRQQITTWMEGVVSRKSDLKKDVDLSSLIVENGVMKKEWESTDGKHVAVLLVVSNQYVPKVLEKAPGGASDAHLEVNKTHKST